MKAASLINPLGKQGEGYEKLLLALSALIAKICVLPFYSDHGIILFKHTQSAVAGTSKMLRTFPFSS